jgi:hypothetical protein
MGNEWAMKWSFWGNKRAVEGQSEAGKWDIYRKIARKYYYGRAAAKRYGSSSLRLLFRVFRSRPIAHHCP